MFFTIINSRTIQYARRIARREEKEEIPPKSHEWFHKVSGGLRPPKHEASTVADVLVTIFSAVSESRGNFTVTKGGTPSHVSCVRFYCFSESAGRAQLFCIHSRKALWNAT
jgi:hypothetical protein